MRTCLLSTLVLLTASTAMAADLTSENPAMSVAVDASTFMWLGAYLGIQGGGGWVNGEFSA